MTFMEILKPSEAPCDIASIRLVYGLFTSNLTSPMVCDCSVSGNTILDITKAPGAAIKLAIISLGAKSMPACAPILA